MGEVKQGDFGKGCPTWAKCEVCGREDGPFKLLPVETSRLPEEHCLCIECHQVWVQGIMHLVPTFTTQFLKGYDGLQVIINHEGPKAADKIIEFTKSGPGPDDLIH